MKHIIYPGVLEVDDIIHDVIKKDNKKEYTRSVKKLLTSNLNGGNVIKAINTYSAFLTLFQGVKKWNKNETGTVEPHSTDIQILRTVSFVPTKSSYIFSKINLPNTDTG